MSKEMNIRVLYVVALTAFFIFLVSPFIIPIFFAATIALTLLPWQAKLVSRGWKKSRAAAILTTLFGVVISIPLFFFLIKGTIAVTDQLEKMSINKKLREQGVTELVSDLRHDFVVSIHKMSSKYEFLNFLDEKKIDQYIGMVNAYLLKFFQGVATSVPEIFILLLIMILCTYSFLNNSMSVKNFFQKIFGFTDDKMKALTKIFINDSRQVYLSNIATGSIQSLMTAIGVTLVGMGDFFVVFFVTLILSFVPVIGAAPVSFLFAIIAFFTGKSTVAIILIVLGGVTGLVDNILRPWLASFGESRIPPLVAFVCVIGGALLLGFPGLFIGLLIGSIAFDTLPIFWEELNTKK